MLRISAFVITGICMLLLLGCGGYKSGSYGETFENANMTYKHGYSGDWYCEIQANGEWYGTFSGSGSGQPGGVRELKGKGNAVVYLPDNAQSRYVKVGNKTDGHFSIRIVGPNHTGEVVTGQGKMEIESTQK
ncbi:MAG: hypothetical protein KAR42_10340 [candidate division Zixibacteria bacterium]|nr:hypothetical protein [candidate division Zixibacteria bacterium]